ncbi:unnamed protein product, partial [Ascophyllum nodosum]
SPPCAPRGNSSERKLGGLQLQSPNSSGGEGQAGTRRHDTSNSGYNPPACGLGGFGEIGGLSEIGGLTQCTQ